MWTCFPKQDHIVTNHAFSVSHSKAPCTFTILPFAFAHNENIKENLQLYRRCTGTPAAWSSCPETVHTGRVCKWQAGPKPGLQVLDFQWSWWDSEACQLSPSASFQSSSVSSIPAERSKEQNIVSIDTAIVTNMAQFQQSKSSPFLISQYTANVFLKAGAREFVPLTKVSLEIPKIARWSHCSYSWRINYGNQKATMNKHAISASKYSKRFNGYKKYLKTECLSKS